jgi:putative salt-induced outer membrane protein YdiY
MNGRVTFAAAPLFVLLSHLAAAQIPSDPTAEIRPLESQLADAMLARNRTQIETLLAPDYVLRGSPDIERQTWIANAVTLCWGDRSDIEAFEARAVGEAIVASFTMTFYVDPATCRAAVLRSLVTDVWARYPEGWRLQVRHSGPVPAEGAGVSAQFGNVPQPPPIWTGCAELSLVATGGNTSTRTLGVGGSLLNRTDTSTTRGSLSFVTSETESVTRARSLTAQARHGRRISTRLEAFGQGGYTRDRFAGISNRTTAEGGIAYRTRLPVPHTLSTEGGIGYTVERRLDGMELSFAIATGTIRYRWRLRPGAELTEDLGAVADLEERSNWRGTSTTSLSVALSQILSFKASHAVEYRNAPVPGFGRTDTRTSAALVISFERR